MTTREQLLEVSKDIFKHLKSLSEIKKDNQEFFKNNEEEIIELSSKDEEIMQLFESIEKLKKELGI
ncbi:hypothetical protein CAPN010_16590 [Capnocytophaga cynodegmi]|uniref:hypothetical protein n=1 Tax=Capnocytophaga cynodegmi TaxID=28189 RepID=UPI001EE20FDF|nr:hypothetical protein [Capnocytophaga cynodegmi]GJQ07501.1 hypothetical protein CAPN010_16590 [Capnocytophaga cynodegmi]